MPIAKSGHLVRSCCICCIISIIYSRKIRVACWVMPATRLLSAFSEGAYGKWEEGAFTDNGMHTVLSYCLAKLENNSDSLAGFLTTVPAVSRISCFRQSLFSTTVRVAKTLFHLCPFCCPSSVALALRHLLVAPTPIANFLLETKDVFGRVNPVSPQKDSVNLDAANANPTR